MRCIAIILCAIIWVSGVQGKESVEKESITLQKAKKIKLGAASVEGRLSDLIFLLRFRSHELDKQSDDLRLKGLPIVTQQISLENMEVEVSLRDKTVYEILEMVAKDLKIEVVYGANAIVLRKGVKGEAAKGNGKGVGGEKRVRQRNDASLGY